MTTPHALENRLPPEMNLSLLRRTAGILLLVITGPGASMAQGAVPARPDLTLGPSFRQAGSTGENLYSANALRQVVISRAIADGVARVFAGIRNDGGTAGGFAVQGFSVGGGKVVIDNFLLQGGRRIRVTGAVRTGRLVANLNPGSRVIVTSEARLLPALALRYRSVRGQSIGAAQGLVVFLRSDPRILDTGTAGFEFESGVPLTR